MSRSRNHRQYHRIKSFNPSRLVQKSNGSSDSSSYKPRNRFEDFDIHGKIKQNIRDQGFTDPTPIQDQAIPHILNGKDVVGSADTGTGKTAAFVIPLVNNLVHDNSKKVLIITPTRELAMQLRQACNSFSRGLDIHATLCIGGTPIKKQISSLNRHPHFVVGTPGRLIDLTKRKKLDLRTFSVVVLDEVDRMLDMGFINDIEYLVGRSPKNRQSLFFSATIPRKLEPVLNKFVRDPVTIRINHHHATANIDQAVVKINGRSKLQVLHDLLQNQNFEKVLVFGRTKRSLNKLNKALYKKGHTVEIIHGDKSQHQRKRALSKFKDDKVQVLLATDVASRGLDIDDITHVINYDLPESKEVYIHRIGRTGRANKTGTALSFVD